MFHVEHQNIKLLTIVFIENNYLYDIILLVQRICYNLVRVGKQQPH